MSDSLTPPHLLMPEVPPALSIRDQWVCWRKEQRGAKWTKVPYDPRTGQHARANDPATWASYTEALLAWGHAHAHYQGLGFVFHDDFTGVDLDHCVAPDGTISPWARALLDRLDTYAEYSPNDGIHLIVAGTIPRGLRRHIAHAEHAEAAIEMYCTGRYFTVTGRRVADTPLDPQPIQEDLLALYQHITGQATTATLFASAENTPTEALSDDELLKRMFSAANGQKTQALWQGSTTGHLSHSEADLALCGVLAFWTANDLARVDRLFRRSGLYRPGKWNEQRGNLTYGQRTVATACNRPPDRVYQSQVATSRTPAVVATAGTQARNTIAGHEGLLSPGGSRTLELLPASGSERARITRELPPLPEELEQDWTYRAGQADLPAVDPRFLAQCLSTHDEGDARLFAHLFRDRWIYDTTTGEWYEWGEQHWREDQDRQNLLRVCDEVLGAYQRGLAPMLEASEQATEARKTLRLPTDQLKALPRELKQRVHKLTHLSNIKRVLEFARSLLPIHVEKWDTDPWLLGVPNGVIDLRSGELRAGRPRDYIRTVIPTEWRGLDAPAPRFEQFLRDIFDDRPAEQRDELIAFLQRALGYGITGMVNEQKFLLLYGEEGRNGKDTLMNALKHVLGEIASVAENEIFLSKGHLSKSGSAKPHVVALQGKRLVWASESERGARFDIDQVKLLTGGGAITARQPVREGAHVHAHAPAAAADQSPAARRCQRQRLLGPALSNRLQPALRGAARALQRTPARHRPGGCPASRGQRHPGLACTRLPRLAAARLPGRAGERAECPLGVSRRRGYPGRLPGRVLLHRTRGQHAS